MRRRTRTRAMLKPKKRRRDMIRGKSEKEWEEYYMKLIEFRRRQNLPLLPWMVEFLERREKVARE